MSPSKQEIKIMEDPTFTPKTKAAAKALCGWLVKCRIPFTWTGCPSISLGSAQTPLARLQSATLAFDLLHQISEAGGADEALLSKINLLLKAAPTRTT